VPHNEANFGIGTLVVFGLQRKIGARGVKAMVVTELIRLAGGLAALALLACPAQAQTLKPWRQAMIIPKADAGFLPHGGQARLRRARGAQG
jgi:hypothetical protein